MAIFVLRCFILTHPVHKCTSLSCACIAWKHVCWNETKDVRGRHGIRFHADNLQICKKACFYRPLCVAIDWVTKNDTKPCWILTSTVTKEPKEASSEDKTIVHYKVNRLCSSTWFFRVILVVCRDFRLSP